MKTFALPLLLALLAVIGCQTNVKNNAQTPAPALMGNDKRVDIQPDVAQAIHILGVHPQKGADGYVRIKIDVQNTANTPQRFLYKIDWFDQGDKLIPLSSAPVRWSLAARETSSLFAVAPTPLAKTFHITFSSLKE